MKRKIPTPINADSILKRLPAPPKTSTPNADPNHAIQCCIPVIFPSSSGRVYSEIRPDIAGRSKERPKAIPREIVIILANPSLRPSKA